MVKLSVHHSWFQGLALRRIALQAHAAQQGPYQPAHDIACCDQEQLEDAVP